MTKPIPKQTISSKVLKAYFQQPEKFVDRDDQCCVEVGRDENSDEWKYETLDFSSVDLGSWLDPSLAQVKSPNQNTSGKSRELLRLCICPLNVDMKAMLPSSWANMWQEFKLLNLKASFLSDEYLPVPPSWFKVPLPGDLKGFVIKPEKWDANLTNFGLSLIYSPSTRITYALLHILLKSELKQKLDRLESLKETAWHPLLLPTILLELRTKLIAPDLTKVRQVLYKVERDIGTHKNYQDREHQRQAGYYATGPTVWKREGFDSMPGILTSIASDCALFDSKCQLNEELLDWIDEVNKSLSIDLSDPKTGNTQPSSTIVSRRLSILRTWLKNNRIRSVYLGHRAGVQVQACLSFMAQRDNDSNVQTAKAALRDSSDMRTIAFVTLLFLPATAAATFFSTTFFNFQKENKVVSVWIWLYCVVALGLTAVVFAGWYWSTKGKPKKHIA